MLKSIQKRKNKLRAQRKARVRGKIFGSDMMPRLSVFKSNKHFYAQAIDDNTGTTLASADGRKLGLKANQEDVKKIAAQMAKNLASKNIDSVVFDRNGYLYHGVVASFADALREAGIKF
ncbi:MAG TPA: 50S ribosomal protein L18 [Sulfurovum sp.]|jgi:large subunit ribosomal protein L18|nr:MAG: 50S ribosomal protein L18 [Sulfurovum sp. 35-42-20]OYY55020.1 MAG: 50S ribosomal protein L18 [Sulfurovum sp. 28-43-6]OYZ24281.1 MAG: 50S ribosomal protein L18 [Sulfurovum sp. 16-42-52]OYZ49242.1 MAG: 50S ribosomal protein L18 [Sulfurovum sp. 24-42-9]OZA43789.1 MAG: 50S ribosomal protein L18 [Sulfurovum sp. 17-42-90]OZA60864.1 MAG: 50S ribosomal protein L18 [Sulfurovum sp. 39-42-12]HQR73005.1 50S ribosomal protein L18 [Sulfurovum sp.]